MRTLTEMRDNTILWLIGGGALAYYLYNKNNPAAASTALPAAQPAALPALQPAAAQVQAPAVIPVTTTPPAGYTLQNLQPATVITAPTIAAPVTPAPNNIITLPGALISTQQTAVQTPTLILPIDEKFQKFLNGDYPNANLIEV